VAHCEQCQTTLERPAPAKHFSFWAEPYSYQVFFCIGTQQQGERWLAGHGDPDPVLQGMSACAFDPGSNEQSKICVWLDRDVRAPRLIHELVHAAVFILRGSGVPITADNDEALAYLVELLFEACYWRMLRPRGSK
jgi:hypothetical protein